MMRDTALLGVAVAYLSMLAALAWVVDRAPALRSRVRHPLVYALALGVYASTWTYFGSVGFAGRAGLEFLAIYVGPTIAALLAPTAGARILRLTRDHQLASVADLYAFRYQSRAAGTLVTVAAIVASLPYIALQIRAVVDAGRVLGGSADAPLASGFVCVLAVFTVVFGARDASSRRAQDGLLAAVAVESLAKLVALAAVGVAALAVLGGVRGAAAWPSEHAEVGGVLHAPARDGGTWTSLVIASFASSFLLPRQFHVAFAEGTTTRALRVAAWAFPLYLLVLNLPILPITWAGAHTLRGVDPDLYVLGIAQGGGRALAAVTFVGGVSAASAMVIVTTLALSSMALNHLVLLAPRIAARTDLYAWLLWARRALIVAIVLAGYGAYVTLRGARPLVDPGVVSFVAFAQFLPGMVGVLAWRRATRQGFIAGLGAGIAVWSATALAPLLRGTDAAPPDDPWTVATFGSLGANALLFALVSLRTRPRTDEAAAAEACVGGAPLRLATARVTDESLADLRRRLGAFIGDAAARQEIERARRELGDGVDAGALATCLDRNLTAIVGPLLARMIVDASTLSRTQETMALADQMRFLDERLRREGQRLEGLAVELDRVRRYLGALLDELPLGACALDVSGAVVLWNRALERMTHVDEVRALGRPVAALPPPWNAALVHHTALPVPPSEDVGVATADGTRVVRVHASRIEGGHASSGVMLLLEDVSDRRELEAKLAHQDRLASIGQLAAGVAHEIGNPLTGIVCVAQNLRDDRDPTLFRERAEDILEQARRIDGIVRSLLAFSRDGRGEPRRAAGVERVSVRELADEAARLVRLDPRSRDRACQVACAEGHVVLGDRRRLLQVLVNLVRNACEASAPGQRVVIDSAREDDRIVMRVCDEGIGISPEVRAKLFEPFVTTKPPNAGTGLGLSVAYGIVREHGGSIALDSVQGAGTTARLALPAAPPAGVGA
jgi:PAS domain S-box-containing protein